MGQAEKPASLATQGTEEGTGPLYHRIYRIRLHASFERTRQAMAELQRSPDDCSPQWIAAFEKTKGHGMAMQVGDEFIVHLPSAWEAPVRVSALSPSHFRFETLEGHIEAGAIEFRIREESADRTIFEIESFARSHGALMDFIYDKIPVARLMQKIMWKKFCAEFAAHVEKNCTSEKLEQPNTDAEVEVVTEKRETPGSPWTKI